MKAEIISIGTELTTGQSLDTNSQWLSQRLAEMGIAVRFHTTLADDLDENVAALRIAAERAKLVVITGGLGPTQDDLTREALAKMAGVELALHEPSLAFIHQLFASRKRPMPERNRVQALFPLGAEPITNNLGTAPGIWFHLNDVVFVAMPGVPSEMYAMFENEVRPRLLAWARTGGVMIERKINCFGAGESALEEKLFDLTRRGHVPEVGITVSDATISLRINAKAANEAEAQKQIEPIERTIRERLGDLVFGVGQEELQHAVAQLLIEKKRTIAVAESLTGGMIMDRLCQVAGVSQVFLGGVVAYDNSIKESVLDVPSELLRQHGAVSPEVASAMALGCRNRFKSDLAISTTGIAGPGGATPNKPVGLVYVGIAWEGGVKSYPYNWFGNREEVRSRSAKMALNIARLHLLGKLG